MVKKQKVNEKECRKRELIKRGRSTKNLPKNKKKNRNKGDDNDELDRGKNRGGPGKK